MNAIPTDIKSFETLPLASFIEKIDCSAYSFLNHQQYLIRQYQPEYMIVEHATYLCRNFVLTQENVNDLELEVPPVDGCHLQYAGSSIDHTLWQDSQPDKGFYKVTSNPIKVEHTSFTQLNTESIQEIMDSNNLIKTKPVMRWASKKIGESKWNTFVGNGYDARLTINVTQASFEEGWLSKWAIVSASGNSKDDLQSETEFRKIYDYLYAHFGHPLNNNGWVIRQISIGTYKVQFIMAKLLYDKSNQNSLTEMSYRLYDKLKDVE